MARQESLDRVYATIALLRSQGVTTLEVKEVARMAKVSRATIYSKHDDWRLVRQVIDGAASDLLPALDASELVNQPPQQLRRLRETVKALSAELNEVRGDAERIIAQLMAQVHKYMVKSNETPRDFEKRARQTTQLHAANEELSRLRALLTDKSASTPMVRVPIPARKEVICVANPSDPMDAMSTLMSGIQDLTEETGGTSSIMEMYISVGLPLCGATDWVQKHRPTGLGTILYLDSCAPTVEFRRAASKLLRRISSKPLHCVYFKTSAEKCLERAKLLPSLTQCANQEDIISKIGEVLVAPSAQEDFDSIIIVS